MRNNPDGRHGVPVDEVRRATATKSTGPAPYTDEVDVNVDGKRLLERGRLLPAKIVVPLEHLVGEMYLLVIARR